MGSPMTLSHLSLSDLEMSKVLKCQSLENDLKLIHAWRGIV